MRYKDARTYTKTTHHNLDVVPHPPTPRSLFASELVKALTYLGPVTLLNYLQPLVKLWVELKGIDSSLPQRFRCSSFKYKEQASVISK